MSTLAERLAEVLPRLERAELSRVARLLLDETGFLDEHSAQLREPDVRRFSCSGEQWCSGEYGGRCDGESHTVTTSRWCPVSGFNCTTCALVDELEDLLRAVPA